MPFSLSTPEISVTIDQKGLSQPTELFKRPFVVEVMGAEFDKPANVSYFALRFPRVQKIHLDRTVADTVSFRELQEMARVDDITLQDDEDRNISRNGTPQCPEQASPSLSNRSTSTESSQSSIIIATASPALSLDAWMRAEGLVMIEEPEMTTANPEEQRAERDCNMISQDFTSPSSGESVPPFSSKRKRDADTIPPEDSCRKRIRTSTVHAEDDQHKRRQSASAIEPNTSKTSKRYELAVAEKKSQNIYSNFMPPLFLSVSLFHLLSHPTQPLCKILHRLQIPVVFSADSVIDCGSATLRLTSMVDGTKPMIRMVYVDAAQVDAVAHEMDSTMKEMMKYHASGQLLADHRVLFFDWNVLRGQERLENVSELEWRRAFVGGVLSGYDQIETREHDADGWGVGTLHQWTVNF